ncbi:MAG: methyltransferase domain-containing protein [Lachnospiraceae bacterium]
MLKSISEKISVEDYTGALCDLNTYLTQNESTDETDILKCYIYLKLEKQDSFYESIQQAFKHNYRNYELYSILAEFYSSQNSNQAYLCLKQALFYCDNKEDREIILSQINEMKNLVSVNDTSIIVLSYNTKDVTKLCLDNIFSMCDRDSIEVIVIDNASKDGSVEMLQAYPGIKAVFNSENKGFPAGCNEGIAVSKSSNDILLLNSDALLMPNSLFWLKMGLYEDSLVGCTGSISNFAGNYQSVSVDCSNYESILRFSLQNNIPVNKPYVKKMFLIGFSLLIHREAFNQVGYLDEIFTPGNFEDTDYGLRMINHGYKMILCRNSFVYHYGHASFKKASGDFSDLISINGEKFERKWNINLSYYTHERSHLVNFIKEPREKKFNILEIGCGCGGTLGYLEYRYPNANIEGIELCAKAAELGSKLFNIRQDNIERLREPLRTDYYDYIIFGDVLEHLNDPIGAINKAYAALNQNGYIVASIPNIMHISVMKQLLNGKFEYADSGVLDRTHLRFFTLRSIIELFENNHFKIEDITLISDGTEKEDGNQELIDQLYHISKDITRNQFEVVQYYIYAKKLP